MASVSTGPGIVDKTFIIKSNGVAVPGVKCRVSTDLAGTDMVGGVLETGYQGDNENRVKSSSLLAAIQTQPSWSQ